MEIRHGLTRRWAFTPALLTGLVTLASVGAFVVGRGANRPDRADAHTVAVAAAAALSAHLEADGRLLTTVAEAIGGDPSRPDDEMLAVLSRLAVPGRPTGIVRTSPTGAPRVVVSVPSDDRTLPGLDLGGQPATRLALELARDAGAPNVVAAPGTGGTRAVLEALPLFGTVDIPVDVGSRRRSLEGFVVMQEPATQLGLSAAPVDVDMALRVVDGNTVLASAGHSSKRTAPGSAAAVPVSTNGVSWTVQAWPTGRRSHQPIVELLAGLLVALVVGMVAAQRERSVRRAVSEAESRAQEVSLVARAGPLLQQSLAVSDVLPVFAVEISDQLGLSAVAIDLLVDDGRLARAFSLGPGIGATGPPPTR